MHPVLCWMPPRILTVLRANKAPTESINLFPVVITLIFEQLELYEATVFLLNFSKPQTCTPVLVQPRKPGISLYRMFLCSEVVYFFQSMVGVFSVAAHRHNPSKSCQSNTCNLLRDVRRVKYAHPPCLTAIPKPNSIIPVCVSTVFIDRFHHFFLNTIKWKCNQKHKLKSNCKSLQRVFFIAEFWLCTHSKSTLRAIFLSLPV